MARTNRRHRATADRVIRIRRKGYTVLPNDLLRDKRLSLKTKGLFAVILSLPQGWNFNVAGLATVAGCGRDAVRSALKELERAGYLIHTQTKGEKGRFAGVIFLYQKDYYAAQSMVAPNLMEVHLAKNRHGCVGSCEVAFSMASSRITGVADRGGNTSGMSHKEA